MPCPTLRHTILIVSVLLTGVTAVRQAHADGPCNYDNASWADNFKFTVDGQIVRQAMPLPLTGLYDCGDAISYPLYDMTVNPPQACPCAGRATDCLGSCYSYAVVDIPNTFSVPYNVTYTDQDGNTKAQQVILTKAELNAYFDEKYAGYTPLGDCDFSQNCHGYSFGVGNWPDDGQNGSGMILADCYWAGVAPDEATLAWNTFHSIKVSGTTCMVSETNYPQITSSSEKFRGSRIYTQSGDCNNAVWLGRAHNGAGFGLFEEID